MSRCDSYFRNNLQFHFFSHFSVCLIFMNVLLFFNGFCCILTILLFLFCPYFLRHFSTYGHFSYFSTLFSIFNYALLLYLIISKYLYSHGSFSYSFCPICFQNIRLGTGFFMKKPSPKSNESFTYYFISILLIAVNNALMDARIISWSKPAPQ